jgi:hypothetical protein
MRSVAMQSFIQPVIESIKRSGVLRAGRLVTAALVLLALAAAPFAVAADEQPSVAGLWQKIDPETGKTVSWFLFVERNGHYEGVIAKLFLRPGDSPNQICSACSDDRKNHPLLGLPLIRGMTRRGLAYENGNILDPRDGNIYDAIMKVSPDGQTLTVHGYLGFVFLGRDEIWHRLPETAFKELDPIIVAQYLPGHALSGKGSSTMRNPDKHPETTAINSYPVR